MLVSFRLAEAQLNAGSNLLQVLCRKCRLSPNELVFQQSVSKNFIDIHELLQKRMIVAFSNQKTHSHPNRVYESLLCSILKREVTILAHKSSSSRRLSYLIKILKLRRRDHSCLQVHLSRQSRRRRVRMVFKIISICTFLAVAASCCTKCLPDCNSEVALLPDGAWAVSVAICTEVGKSNLRLSTLKQSADNNLAKHERPLRMSAWSVAQVFINVRLVSLLSFSRIL